MSNVCPFCGKPVDLEDKTLSLYVKDIYRIECTHCRNDVYIRLEIKNNKINYIVIN
jgi:hypothetical protein